MKAQYILLNLSFLIILLGVNLIYSARKYVNKMFPKGDINNATKGLKIVGVLVSSLGLILAYFNI